MNDSFKRRMEEVKNWAEKEEKSSQFVKKGIEYHIKARECSDKEEAKKLYMKSIKNWEKVVSITNGESDHNQLVSICWEADLIDKGETYLRLWLANFPNNSYAHAYLASLHELRGDIEKTKTELQNSIALNPDDPVMYERLADIYVKEDNIYKAIEIYRPLIEHFTNDVDTGIHCGAYKYFISLCLKNNNVNELGNLIEHIFMKLDVFIKGKDKPKIYSIQNAEWYIYKREEFNKTIKEIFICELEKLLENNNISKAEELLNSVGPFLKKQKINIFRYYLIFWEQKFIEKRTNLIDLGMNTMKH